MVPDYDLYSDKYMYGTLYVFYCKVLVPCNFTDLPHGHKQDLRSLTSQVSWSPNYSIHVAYVWNSPQDPHAVF